MKTPRSTGPYVLGDDALKELFDREAQDRAHGEFVEKAKANPALQKQIEEIKRLEEEDRGGIEQAKAAISAVVSTVLPAELTVDPRNTPKSSRAAARDALITQPRIGREQAAPEPRIAVAPEDDAIEVSPLPSPAEEEGGSETSETRERTGGHTTVQGHRVANRRANRGLWIIGLLAGTALIVLLIVWATHDRGQQHRTPDSVTGNATPQTATAIATATATATVPLTATAPVLTSTATVLAPDSAPVIDSSVPSIRPTSRPAKTATATARVSTTSTAAIAAPPPPTPPPPASSSSSKWDPGVN